MGDGRCDKGRQVTGDRVTWSQGDRETGEGSGRQETW